MSEAGYDCNNCPGYCCAYPIIQVTGADIKRLAKHLRKTEAEVRSSYTHLENTNLRGMNMTADKLMKTKSCVFLDKDWRQCTVYAGRPQICRDHPGDRCEWYDRSLIEQAMAKGKKVILLREMPWTIDADYPLYEADGTPALLKAYAEGDGKINSD